MSQNQDIFNKLEDIKKAAVKKGADQVKVCYAENQSAQVSVLDGEVERIQSPENSVYTIDVYLGDKQGSTTINSARPEVVIAGIDRAIFSASLKSDDPYAALLTQSELPASYATLDSVDSTIPTESELLDRAKAACNASLSGQSKIVTSSSAASWGKSASYILTSEGFNGFGERTVNSLYAMPKALQDGKVVSDYTADSQIYLSDMKTPDEIGQSAAEKTVRLMGAKEIQPYTGPVIFDPRISASLVAKFFSAMSGGAVLENKSFLRDMLNQKAASANLTIIDDPLVPRGMGSFAFDEYGVASQKRIFVDKGVPLSWIFGTYSVRKFNDTLGTQFETTGHSGRSPSVYVPGGQSTPAEMIANIKDGVYIYSLMNLQVDPFDGSFSSPASGFIIQDGKLSTAFEGAAIGGNLIDLFSDVEFANDLDRLKHQNIPTMLCNRPLTIR